MTEFLCVYCEKKIPEKESYVCLNCNRIFCKEHYQKRSHECPRIENPIHTRPKATKKQEWIAVGIILPILVGGMFAIVFGVQAIIGGIGQDDEGYGVLIGVLAIPIIGSLFGIMKLLEKIWGVKFSQSSWGP